MITVSQLVEEGVDQSPYLREAITDGLVNISALARKLQPQIEKRLYKKVTEGSILIALQRYANALEPYYQVNPAKYLANLTVRSDLFEMTVVNSPVLLDKLSQVANSRDKSFSSVFVFTQGSNETTIITNKSIQHELEKALFDEQISQIIPDLTGIALQRTHGQIETTGVLQFPLRFLAWEGISVIEIITTINEIMVTVRDFEVDRAISSIRQALKSVSEQK